MKFTKIVSTLGPASNNYQTIEKLLTSGVNVFRLNFKHGEIVEHEQRIRWVREAIKKTSIPAAVMMDVQGPSFRIILDKPEKNIKPGDTFVLGSFEFGLTHPHIIPLLKKNTRLLVDDGKILFTVEEEGEKAKIIAHTEALLKTRKSFNIPGVTFPVELLTERDLLGIEIAVKEQIEMVAFSFARNPDDIRDVRKKCEEKGYKGMLVAKLETQQCLEHLDEIVRLTDAVMVARGDLAVESPFEQVPYHQKTMIETCLKYSKPVITATQMMDSMERNPQPTRAEVSDVANAIYDRTDAIMTSGETAAGKYPVETVQAMATIASFHEKAGTRFLAKPPYMDLYDKASRIAHTAAKLYEDYITSGNTIAAFVVFTHSGRTARLISHYRPQMPIFAFTPSDMVVGQLCLSYGVFPIKHLEGMGEMQSDSVKERIHSLVQTQKLKRGDVVIVVHGEYWATTGGTSSIRIMEA